jgi:excisionase family DNA binding protein
MLSFAKEVLSLKESPDRLLGIREVADLFGVDISTVRRWDEAGHLQSVRVGNRGHRRFRQEDIRRLLQQRAPGKV